MPGTCSTCGNDLPENARLCISCGAAVTEPLAADAPPPASPQQRIPWKIVLPVAALVVAIAVAGVAWLLQQNPLVPGLTGLDPVQAQAALSSAGFELGETTYDPASAEPTWTVIAQTTDAGERLRRGSAIGITLAGAEPAAVPGLVGLTRADAESALASATLTPGAVTESYNATAPAGTVLSQDPVAGTSVPEGTPVGLVISKGPQPVPVPTATGKMDADAIAALEQAGFVVKRTEKDDAAAKGTVLSQSPAAGEQLVPGSTVEIVVSTGVEMVKVPSWRSFPDNTPMTDEEYEQYGLGKAMERTEAAIIAGFERVGLKAVVEWSPDWTKDSYQTPKAGTMVPKGTTVKIFLFVAD